MMAALVMLGLLGLRVVLVMLVFTVPFREVGGVEPTHTKEFYNHKCWVNKQHLRDLGDGCSDSKTNLWCVSNVPPSPPEPAPSHISTPPGVTQIEPGICKCPTTTAWTEWDEETGKCYSKADYDALIKARPTTTPKVDEKPTTTKNSGSGATSLKIGSSSGLLAGLLGILGVVLVFFSEV